MDTEYSNGIKNFLALSVEDLKKMRTNALYERQRAEEKWKKIAKIFYREHYLINEEESLAYCPTYARILYVEVQRNLKSNKPYTSQIIRDPNNALSPIFGILDKDRQKKVGFKGQDNALLDFQENIESLRKEVDEMIASNLSIADAIQKCYSEITLFGNCCLKLEKTDLKTCEYVLEHVPLNKILIQKNNTTKDIVYFFRDLKMDILSFKSYFTEQYSLDQVKSYYSSLDEPENQSKQDINITECSYYCRESSQTVIRYFLNNDTINDLEQLPRYKNYQVFWLNQINAENETYGSIDDKDYQNFLSVTNKQETYRDLMEVQSKIQKSRTLDIVSLIQEKELENNFGDGVKTWENVARYNRSNVKNISIVPQQIEAFGGNLRNQNLEDPENNQRYAILEAVHYKNIEEFANNLNFDEAQKKMLIPMAERKDTTATEFKELLFASTADKRKLEILENFTGSFYSFMIEFIVFNYANKIAEYNLKKSGQAVDYMVGADMNQNIDEAFYKILELEKNLTEEELKKNPYSMYLDTEKVLQVKTEYGRLKQIYNEAEDITIRARAEIELKKFAKVWENVIQSEYVPILNQIKSLTENAIEKDDLGNMAVISSSKEFALFILNFKQYSKKIKFKLASAEANILQNQDNQNWLKLVNTIIGLTSQIGDPELTRKLIILANVEQGLEDIGMSLNLGNKLILGKDLEEKYEQDKMERIQMQQQLQGITNNQQ